MYNIINKINIINTINRFCRFDCKKPIQLQRHSTEAAFTQIPNNLQATKPNSSVKAFVKHQYLQISPLNCLYVLSSNGYISN